VQSGLGEVGGADETVAGGGGEVVDDLVAGGDDGGTAWYHIRRDGGALGELEGHSVGEWGGEGTRSPGLPKTTGVDAYRGEGG